ncbi:hypothetical protein DM01DRAFT_1382195 [Hesseltinella vesiculosa]|uniref:UBZ4-type domain-containing protein n=1 Tax=Hesseltinella vesiculosa TaxID=101127 RepID=A0A1X2GLM7_9FUNG|nr:hypothetical protein DM01DRAFT_1382195 [Hesseltinella vesiculosa]
MDHNPFRSSNPQPNSNNNAYQGAQPSNHLPLQQPQSSQYSQQQHMPQVLNSFDPIFQQQQPPQPFSPSAFYSSSNPMQMQPLQPLQPTSYGYSNMQQYPANNTNGNYLSTWQQPVPSQQPQIRHPPVDAASLLKSSEVKKIECPVCHKTIEGDAAAINFHVNDHY